MVSPLFQVDNAYVLLWDFADLIHPMLKLESPHEIFCFRFNPSIPGVSYLAYRDSWQTDCLRVPCFHCCIHGKNHRSRTHERAGILQVVVLYLVRPSYGEGCVVRWRY